MIHRSPATLSERGRGQRHQSAVEIRKRGRDTRVAAERTARNNPAELPLSKEERDNLQRHGILQIVDDFRKGTAAALKAAVATRKLLASESDLKLADKLIALGLADDLCAALDRTDSPRLQFEALWAISNCALVRPDAVVHAGSLQKIVHLLEAPNMTLREQALWSLGNIASKATQFRNQLLEMGALERIRASLVFVHGLSNSEYEDFARANEGEDALKNSVPGLTPIPLSKKNFIRQVTWAMSNVIRGGDVDDLRLREITLSLPILRELLFTSDDNNIIANVVWVLADYAEKRPRAILELGVCDRILELALHPAEAVQGGASQCLSNICAGDGQGLRFLMLLKCTRSVFISHLRSERSALWTCASWTLSYACAELPGFCDRLTDSIEVFVEKLADNRVASEVRQDCVTILSMYLTTERGLGFLNTSTAPIKAIVDALGDGIEFDVMFAAKLVHCAANILSRGGRALVSAFEELGGIEHIHRLEGHQERVRSSSSNPLHIALESVQAVLADCEEEEAFFEARPTTQSMVRIQPKHSQNSRQMFQSFLKD